MTYITSDVLILTEFPIYFILIYKIYRKKIEPYFKFLFVTADDTDIKLVSFNLEKVFFWEHEKELHLYLRMHKETWQTSEITLNKNS